MLIVNCLLLWMMHSLTVAVRFHLEPGALKCLKDKMHKDVLVKGGYEITHDFGVTVNIKVEDSKGHTLYQKHDAKKGAFALTTEEDEEIDICFQSHVPHGQHSQDGEVYLVVKHGVEAKSYEALAKAEKLQPLEAELRFLEDLADSLTEDFDSMQLREQEMKDTNESTAQRIMYLFFISVVCVLFLSSAQLAYLRRFFKAKKLLD